MIPRLWTCKELALIAAIVALACIAAFLSIKLTRPKPFASATLGVESQGKPQAVDHELAQDCSHQAGQFAGKAELVAPGVAGVRFPAEFVEVLRALRPPEE